MEPDGTHVKASIAKDLDVQAVKNPGTQDAASRPRDPHGVLDHGQVPRAGNKARCDEVRGP